MGTFNKLDFVREELKDLPALQDFKPKRGSAMRTFSRRIANALQLVLSEKEILVFSALQWVAIGLGYFLWVQMLGWIPDDIWESAKDAEGVSLADIILLIWSFIIVGIVAFPVGILSACIGAVHFLHRSGQPSTVATCLQMVGPKAWPVWAFHWVDGWITVNQILERLPKKDDNTTPVERALSEALYYAWKIGTAGVLPGLVAGKSLIGAGKDSILFVKDRFKDVATLRVGYSAICWIVGIATYVGGVALLVAFPDLMPSTGNLSSDIHGFYIIAGLPLMIALGIVVVILRPVYLIAISDIYSDYLEAEGRTFRHVSATSRLASALAVFGVLALALGIAYFFRDELGIMDMLATPYLTAAR